MEKRTLVILANSVKHHGHCVAGKCIKTRQWIRPVSNIDGGELNDDQVKYHNNYGTYHVKTLQKIEMQLLDRAPLQNQPENYLISNNPWQQRYNINITDLYHYLDRPYNLWGEGSYISYEYIESGWINIDQSLYLVNVEDLELYRNGYGKRRASFTYNNVKYDLAVTDPNFDDILYDGRKTNNILCISLGENFQGHCYKLVATIF